MLEKIPIKFQRKIFNENVEMTILLSSFPLKADRNIAMIAIETYTILKKN